MQMRIEDKRLQRALRATSVRSSFVSPVAREIEIGQVFPIGSPWHKLRIFDETGRRVGD